MQKCRNKMGIIYFASEIKRVENNPDFEKMTHVNQHSLLVFIIKNIEGESTEAIWSYGRWLLCEFVIYP